MAELRASSDAETGAEIFTPVSASELARSSAVVVPGVGHFGATSYFDDDWRREIRAAVADGVPLLGICLGLQWLFEGSEEAPLPGLGLLAGQCAKLPAVVKVPHVGWNSLDITRPSPLLEGVATARRSTSRIVRRAGHRRLRGRDNPRGNVCRRGPA